MIKLPKLINRYTSSKDYYSYEKDYLYYLTYLMKQFEIQSPQEFVDTFNKFEFSKENRFWACFVYDFFFSCNFPVYYIFDDLIEMTLNSKINNNVKIVDCFIDNAVFLFPKNNKLGIKFCTVRNNIDIFGKNDNNCITSRMILSQKFGNLTCTVLIVKNKLGSNINYQINNVDPVFNFSKEALNNIISQIFLYMSAYSETKLKVIAESNTCGIGFKQSQGKLMTPPTIGFAEKKYVENQKRLVNSTNPNLQGIKKQTHWRRGHWRNQLKLIEGKKDTELIWIRPMLINPS